MSTDWNRFFDEPGNGDLYIAVDRFVRAQALGIRNITIIMNRARVLGQGGIRARWAYEYPEPETVEGSRKAGVAIQHPLLRWHGDMDTVTLTCGAFGWRFLFDADDPPEDWPPPYVVFYQVLPNPQGVIRPVTPVLYWPEWRVQTGASECLGPP